MMHSTTTTAHNMFRYFDPSLPIRFLGAKHQLFAADTKPTRTH